MRNKGLKRSQVEAIINATIRNYIGHIIVREDIDLRPISSDMLITMETMGMLPPCRDANQKSSYGYARVYKWEDEDETL